MRTLLIGAVAILSLACSGDSEGQPTPPVAAGTALDTATFAGGCFWCVEEAFDEVEGVISTTSGYMGGQTSNPSYEEVSSGGSGHVEVVQVVFDPDIVGYDELLDVFWPNIDPLTRNRQFCDAGPQYRAVIFPAGSDQRQLAESSKAALERSGRFDQPIVTEITPASAFYPAEEYHQDYYQKNPVRYRFYKFTCGRAQRLADLWGPS
ncbi:MAG: peptide-methionine (S)-S-oxide reductase MsrA [Gemmatimonadota bacterium]